MEETEKDLGYWADRINAVQMEARAHGICSAVVMLQIDQFDDTEDKAVNYVGAGPLVMYGMAEYLKHVVGIRLIEQEDL